MPAAALHDSRRYDSKVYRSLPTSPPLAHPQAAGLSPDVHTYTSLIAGCAYGRQAALARELMRHMQQRGVQPSTWTHNAMLKASRGSWAESLAGRGGPGLALLILALACST